MARRSPKKKGSDRTSRKGRGTRRAPKASEEPEYIPLGEPIPGSIDFLYGRHKLDKLWKRFASADRSRRVKFKRITVGPNQLGGVPCIRGLRIPVVTVVELLAQGMSDDEILKAYPDLTREDIREALRYAAETLRERALPLTTH